MESRELCKKDIRAYRTGQFVVEKLRIIAGIGMSWLMRIIQALGFVKTVMNII
jgi:hypothetical protein